MSGVLAACRTGRPSFGRRFAHVSALTDRERRADEREVGERLREVAELPAGDGVVLLGEQPDVVAEVEQSLEQLAGLVELALPGEYLDQPERAGEKDALARREPVDVAVLVGEVAEDEAVDQ